MPERTVQLIACRHTRSAFNAEDRYTGQIDAPLDVCGEQEADELAEQLAAFPVRGVFSSDLQRTIGVAKRIANVHALTVQLDTRLREVHIGRMGRLRKSDALREFPDPTLRGAHPAFDFRSIGGESRAQVLERMRACCTTIVETHGTEQGAHPHIVIVSHGTALRVLLEYLGIHEFHEQGSFQIVTFPRVHP